MELNIDDSASMVISKGRVIIGTEKTIICVDPETCEIEVLDAPIELDLCSVHPGTGEVVAVSVAAPYTFMKVNVDTQTVTPMAIGKNRCLSLCYTGRLEEQVVMTPETLERWSGSGEVLEVIELPPQTNPVVRCTQNGIFFSTSTAVFYWQLEPHGSPLHCMAGHVLVGGEGDGIGWRARFRALRAPAYMESRYVAIRDHPGGWEAPPSRLILLDTYTDEVFTVAVDGFDLGQDMLSMAIADEVIYMLVRRPQGEDLLRAKICDVWQRSLTPDVLSIDFTAGVKQVTFRLASGDSLHFDRRLLMARSNFFRTLLSSGGIEDASGVIDLSEDASVERASLEVVLRFIACDALTLDQELNTKKALQVAELAKRYQLEGLLQLTEARLAEGQLLEGLSKATVQNYFTTKGASPQPQSTGGSSWRQQLGGVRARPGRATGQ